MTRKKCHILNCVLDTFPEHLKAEAKSMCDILKCKDRIFVLPSHEILIDGVVDRGSNIRDYIMDSLFEPPVPGTPKFRMLEKENGRLKRNLPYYEKALAQARGMSRCRKFESIIDGAVDRCEFSDDTNSDESDKVMTPMKTKIVTRMVTEPKMMTRMTIPMEPKKMGKMKIWMNMKIMNLLGRERKRIETVYRLMIRILSEIK